MQPEHNPPQTAVAELVTDPTAHRNAESGVGKIRAKEWQNYEIRYIMPQARPSRCFYRATEIRKGKPAGPTFTPKIMHR
jgi:hypothetical protein